MMSRTLLILFLTIYLLNLYVRVVFTAFNLSKSSGLEDIHTLFLVRVGADVLESSLSYVFNTALCSVVKFLISENVLQRLL